MTSLIEHLNYFENIFLCVILIYFLRDNILWFGYSTSKLQKYGHLRKKTLFNLWMKRFLDQLNIISYIYNYIYLSACLSIYVYLYLYIYINRGKTHKLSVYKFLVFTRLPVIWPAQGQLWISKTGQAQQQDLNLEFWVEVLTHYGTFRFLFIKTWQKMQLLELIFLVWKIYNRKKRKRLQKFWPPKMEAKLKSSSRSHLVFNQTKNTRVKFLRLLEPNFT